MNKCSVLLKVPDEPPEDPSVKLPELLDDLALYEWAGVSFGRSDIFRLHLALKKFVEKAQLPSETERLRFVGRFATRTLPYFIVEGLASDDPENMDERLQEGRNGANKFVYYVSQSLESDVWVKLPHVTAEQIIKVKQTLSALYMLLYTLYANEKDLYDSSERSYSYSIYPIHTS